MPIRRSRRDEDLRGTSPRYHWSKLCWMVRQEKPGALEVLQDALEEVFPKQFAKAREDARHRTRLYPSDTDDRREYVVTFNARIARYRHLPQIDARSAVPRLSPFSVRNVDLLTVHSRRVRELGGFVGVKAFRKPVHAVLNRNSASGGLPNECVTWSSKWGRNLPTRAERRKMAEKAQAAIREQDRLLRRGRRRGS